MSVKIECDGNECDVCRGKNIQNRQWNGQTYDTVPPVKETHEILTP